jgi:hypothetical protein
MSKSLVDIHYKPTRSGKNRSYTWKYAMCVELRHGQESWDEMKRWDKEAHTKWTEVVRKDKLDEL